MIYEMFGLKNNMSEAMNKANILESLAFSLLGDIHETK